MRILIVAYGAREGHSGFKHRVLQMASELAAQKHTVTLLWYYSFRSLFRKHDLKDGYPFEVITVPTLPFFFHRRISPIARFISSVFMRLFLRFRKFDAIQAELPWCAALVGRTGVKLVVDWHGAGVAERLLNGDPQWKVRLQAEYERIALSKADAVITVSTRLGARVRHATRERRPEVVVAPCWVDTDAFARTKGGRAAMRREFGMDGRVVLCYLGGLQVWQCVDGTLEMAARLRRMDSRVQLLLLTQDNTAPYEEALARIGERGRDVVCVAASQDDVRRILPAADLGLLLRTRDEANEVASPTKLGEYLAAGVPVLTTRHAGDAADVIASEQCGLVLSEPLPEQEEIEEIPPLLDSIMFARESCAARCRSAAVRHRHQDVARRALEQLYGAGDEVAATTSSSREAAL